MTFVNLSVALVGVLALMTSYAHGQGCRVADAALRYDDSRSYLFMGPDAITLDESGKEKSIDNKDEDWGGLQRMDAAVMWQDRNSYSKSWYPLFLEGTTYSYYSYWYGSSYGPYPLDDEDFKWNPELNFDKGIDAAATLDGKTLFFKWCSYFEYDHEKDVVATAVGTLEGLGLPCDVHAALAMGESDIGIIKYDQMWILDVSTLKDGQANITGPLDANDVMGLTSIRLCSEHEDAGESLSDLEDDTSEEDSSVALAH